MEPDEEVVDFNTEIWKSLTNVNDTNLYQNKITFEEWQAADRATHEMFNYPYGQPDKTPFPPVYDKISTILRLASLRKMFPIFQGVYQKYASQVEIPVYCINCGTQLSRTARFCPDCGTQVTTAHEE